MSRHYFHLTDFTSGHGVDPVQGLCDNEEGLHGPAGDLGEYVLLVLININFHYLLQLLGVCTIFADIILQTFLAISSCLRLSGAVVPTPYKCGYKCPSS